MQYLTWVGHFISLSGDKEVHLQYQGMKVRKSDLDKQITRLIKEMREDGYKLWQEKYVVTYT